jgi:LPXTG-site transpeptidase (sortase) family protein
VTAVPGAGPWWQPLPIAHTSFVPVRLVIEKLRIGAPIEVRGTDAHNVMEAPDRPSDVAWYRFTARPGSGSNAVFAGHRDFAKVGPAVFWKLGDLATGDLIDVVSPQQTEIRYRVSQVRSYPVGAMPMNDVLAADVGDEVTLITCAGRYTPDTGYDHRLVVRARRMA